MGRELRKVPPNWKHPTKTDIDGREYSQPMYNQRFEDAAKEWKEELARWERKEFPEYIDEESKLLEYWEWNGGPPDRAYFRPWKDEEATWFQVWETVSEGTPVSPPFATKEELIEYLVANGDFWDQRRREESFPYRKATGPAGWTRASAEKFVNGPGWALSLVVDKDGVRSGVEDLGR